VLIPLLFMGDVVGRLFREFAITMAIGHPDLAGGVADAHADDVRAHAAPARPKAHGCCTRPRAGFFDRVIARYGRMLDWVLNASGLTCWSFVGTLALTAALPGGAQGLLPGAGHGRDPGHDRGPQSISFSRHGRAPAGAWPSGAARPGVASLSSFIGVDGTNATLNSGRMLINLKPNGRARRAAPSEVIAAWRRPAQKVPGITCTCSRCRT
jgi:multidrug efflux pump